MWMYIIALAVGGILTFAPQSVGALSDSSYENMTVLDVALAEDIQDREPVGPVTPSILCEENDQPRADLPVVDSSVMNNGTVYFWNTVHSSTHGTLSHVWLMKRNEEWKPMAIVDLKIGKSPSYRTWSSKKFDPKRHVGEWKIEVVKAENPDQVMCHSRFRVE